MFRLIGDRCTGKTRQLMQYAKDNNAVFVCSNPYSMMQKSRKLWDSWASFYELF